MKISLVGATNQQWSLPFNAERTINFFPVYDQAGKEVSALYGTAGLELFARTGSQAHRQSFTSSNGRCFFVAGARLYEVTASGDEINRGTLLSSSGNVSMDENDTQLGICDGELLYTLTYTDNTFAQVTDVDLPSSVGFLTVIDSYFVVTDNGSGRFYISDLGDGSSWQALEFATAESNPDELKAVINALGQLWLMGTRTTELWTNTGASDFPFRRVSGGVLQYGVVAPHSALEVGNSIIWLGRDKFGDGLVYQTSGVVPEVISTEPINILIEKATDKENIKGWAYQEKGHTFYVLTGGGLETSLVYDLSTRQWHERSYNDEGALSQHLGSSCTFAFGKHLVGDRRNGNVYSMGSDNYSDNGEDIVSERIYTHISDNDRRIRYNNLDISLEVGVGAQAGASVDPQISMQLSKDGAKTWSNWYNQAIGKIGKYRTKVTFRRLGIAETMTFKVRISSQVKKALTGSYIR